MLRRKELSVNNPIAKARGLSLTYTAVEGSPTLMRDLGDEYLISLGLLTAP